MSEHPLFKLGRRIEPADPRTIPFARVLKNPLAVPRQYDFDLAHPDIPTPMFGNDKYNCAVVSAAAHQLLRFELIGIGSPMGISDAEVLQQYFKLSSGQNESVGALAFLRAWRNQGWMAGGQRVFLHSFASINPASHEHIRQAVYADLGVSLGLNLPLTAQAQVQAGRPWDLQAGVGTPVLPGSWGSHLVAVVGFTAAGPVCVTWGRKQQMTWAFVDRYCDEAYALFSVDTATAGDNPKAEEAMDFLVLEALVKAVDAESAP